jgi:predicted ATPase/transcriptional regulator with XRE-family HTH domain
VRSGEHIGIGAFGERVRQHLRNGGYSQKQLAIAMSLNPRVLSRKLTGSSNAYLSHLEIKRIITTLAEWRAITTQDEALSLLDAAGVEPAIFTTEEWQIPPLNTLVKASVQSAPLPGADFQRALPASATRLIGREWAVDRLHRLLEREDVRLVTLVGPGGSGKTRLALHMASVLSPLFAHGACFVSLARVHDTELLPLTILQALQVGPSPDAPPLQSLASYLSNKQLLLVLDNFERVAAAASVLGELLAIAPNLKLLVTSRMVLHVYGEHEFIVPPLDMPPPDVPNKPADLLNYGAIRLFVERAQAVQPDFTLTTENAPAIIQICARVDGLPLALELAAARIKILRPAALLDLLRQARLPLLIGGPKDQPIRLQTMHDTISWSYDLLSPVEQTWFCRFSVFSGGWSLEAAEAMMFASAADQELPPAIDILTQLVDSSLVVQLPATTRSARFTMLETVREYALARLTAQEDYPLLRDWHAWYYLRKAEAGEIGLRGQEQRWWLAHLGESHDNFRAALEWSLQQAREGQRIRTFVFPDQPVPWQPRKVAGSRILSTISRLRTEVPALELCLRLASALRHYWEWRGELAEARHWLLAALDVLSVDEAAETLLAARAKALSEASRMMCLQNDQARAMALADESIALGQQLHDPLRVASTMLHKGWAAHAMGEYAMAKAAYREGLQYLAAGDDTWMRAQLIFHQAAVVGFTGNFAEMHDLYAQARTLFEQLGDKSSLADLMKDLGGLSLLEGNSLTAIDYLIQSLKRCYELNHRQHMTTGMCLLSMAMGMHELPDAAQASLYSAQLEGVSESLEETIGLTPWLKGNPLVQAVRQQIRSRVDEQSWQAAFAAGRALTLPGAMELVSKLGEELLAGKQKCQPAS